MKTKVLFTAALMAAAASGAQAASYTESNMLLQLLESQRYEGVSLLADETPSVRDVATLTYNGEAVASGAQYYLYNLGAQKFLEGGNDWGVFSTFAEVGIPITFTQVDGNLYTLNTGMGFIDAEGYMDHGEANLTLAPVQGAENVYTLGTGTVYFGYDGSTTKMSVNLSDASSANAQWILVSRSQREGLLEQATAESGVDASFFIVNPNFSRNYNPWGWTDDGKKCTPVPDPTFDKGQFNNPADQSDKMVEIYDKDNVNFHQTVTGLPNGKYVVSCFGVYRNGDPQPAADSRNNGNEVIHAVLYAGEKETPFESILEGFNKRDEGSATITLGEESGKIPNWPDEMAIYFQNGVYSRREVEVTVTDGTLTFGVRKAEMTYHDWTLFDSFRLTYYGEDLTAMAEALEAKVNEIHALAETLNGQAPTSYIEQLRDYQAPSCSTNTNAINAANALIEEVNAAQTEFANAFLSATEYAEQVLAAFPSADESAKSTLNSAIEAATTAALASTDATVWATQAEAVRAAAKTYFDATDKVMAEGVSNFDVTQLFMVNPGFEDAENPLEGWNGFAPDVSLGWAQVLCNAHYAPTFDFYQEMAVPNGLYVASVQEHATIGDKTDLYLQSSYQRQTAKMNWNTAVPVENWAENQDGNRATTGTVLVTDGTVRIGVNLHRAESRLQLYFDNFRLTLVSDGLAEIKALYDALKLQAEAIETEGMPTVFAKALTDALALPVGTAAQYYTAYNALQKAVADCGTVADASVSLPALITECQAYLDNSEGGDEARATLEDALEAAEGYMNLTTAEEIVACEAALETARQEFAKVATPTGDQQFDMTFLVKNPDANGLVRAAVSDYGWVSCTNSWANNFANGNGNNIAEFYESYQNGAFAAGTWVLWQTVNLPAGSYEMTLRAFGENANGAGSGPLVASVYAGNVKGDAVASTEEVGLENKNEKLNGVYGVSFFNATTSDVQLGVMTEEGNGANWVGCNDMKLYKVAPVAEELALDETQAYAVTADMYANVTMRRTLKAGHWNTFCVPFDMTPEQLAANGISEVRTFSQAAAQGTSVTLQTTLVSDGVKAGMPYIVKVSGEENVTEISVDGVSVTAAEPASHEIVYSDAGYVEWRGNYSAGTVPMGAYFISDDMFYVADTEVALNGFRAYVMLVDEAGAPVQSNVNRMLIDIDGEVTGIEDVLGDGASDANKLVNVYTIGGVLVKSQVKKGEALDGLQKGAYIVDGKTYLK